MNVTGNNVAEHFVLGIISPKVGILLWCLCKLLIVKFCKDGSRVCCVLVCQFQLAIEYMYNQSCSTGIIMQILIQHCGALIGEDR